MPVSSVTLPNGVIVNLPSPVESEEEAKRIVAKYAVAKGLYTPVKEDEEDSDIVPGLQRGYYQSLRSLSSGTASVMGYLGFEDTESYFDKLAEEYGKDSEEYTRRIENLDKATENVGNFVDYAQQVIAENVPNMGVSLAGAAAGAGIGAVASGPAAPAGALIGAALGAFVPSAVMGAGQIREEIKEINPELEGTEGPELLGGVAVGALDALALGKIFKPVISPFISNYGAKEVANELVRKGVGRRVAEGIARGALVEAPTEAAQEAIQAGTAAATTGTEFNLEELTPRLVEAAVAGGLTGGFVGGITGIPSVGTEVDTTSDQEKGVEQGEEITAPAALALPKPPTEAEAKVLLEEISLNNENVSPQDLTYLTEKIRKLKIAEEVQKEMPTLFIDSAGEIDSRNPLERWRILQVQKQETARKIQEAKEEAVSDKRNVEYSRRLKRQAKLLEEEQARIEGNVDKALLEYESITNNLNELRGVVSKEIATPIDTFLNKVSEGDEFTAQDVAVESRVKESEAREFLEKNPFVKKQEDGTYTKQAIRFQKNLKNVPKVDLLSTVPGNAFFNERAVAAAANQPVTSDETLVYLSPEQFLGLSQSPITAKDKDKKAQTLRKSNTAFDTLPFIRIDNEGQVLEADGRSRAREIFRTGTASSIPVIVKGPFQWGQTGVRPDLLRSFSNPNYVVNFPPIETFPTEQERAINRLSGKTTNKDWTKLKLGLIGRKPSKKLVSLFDNLIDKIPQDLTKMLGGGFALEFQESIYTPSNNPVRGAQVGNTLYVALTNNKNIEETAFHEAWHYLRNSTSLLTDADKKLLASESANIRRFVSDNTGILEQDLENLSNVPQHVNEEMEAWAAGIFMSANKKPPAFSVFQKFKQALRRLKNWLNGNGFRTFEDLFDDVRSGARASSARNQELVDSIQEVRYQDFVKEHHDKKLSEIHAERPAPVIEKTREEDIENTNYNSLGKFQSFLMSMPGAAVKDPFLAKFVNTYKAKEEDKLVLITGFREKLEKLATKENFNQFAEVLDYLSYTEQDLPTSGPVVYEKEGRTFRLSPELSDEVRSLNDLFKEVPLRLERLVRTLLPDYGLDSEATLGSIRDRIEEMNTEAAEARALEKTANIDANSKDKSLAASTLASLYEHLVQAQTLQRRETAYFPHIRFGNWGVTVHRKEDLDSNGNIKLGASPVYFGTIEDGVTGTYDVKGYDRVKEEIKKLGFSGQNYVIAKKPFRLSYNILSNKIGVNNISLEVIASLLGSNKKEDYETTLQFLKDKVSSKGFAKHLTRRKNIPGYSKDFLRASQAYLISSANYINNAKYEDAFNKLETELAGAPLSRERRDNIESYVKYATSPETDFIGLRTFNFLYTMGGNISTALLQFVTLPTTTAGLMLQTGSKNFLQHNVTLARNLGKVSKHFIVKDNKFMDWKTGEIKISQFFTKNHLNSLVKRNVLNEDLANAIYKMFRRGQFNPNFTNEQLGGTSVETETFRGQVRQKFDAATRGLGVFTATSEYMSRLTTFMSLFESMSNESRVQQALENLKNDARFQDLRADSNLTDKEAIAAYYLDRAHAIFGKEGRGPLQRGLWGSLVFPFMSHPIQIMELWIDGLKGTYGRDGRLAAAYTLGVYLSLAGLMGVPGYELIESIIEFAYKKTTGKTLNLEHEIRNAFAEAGVPGYGEFATGGFTRAMLDVNIAQRINMPVFFQNPLIGMLEGNPSIRDFTGVTGSLIEGAGKALEAVENERYGSAALGLTPTAFRNLVTGLIDYNTVGYRTSAGNTLIRSEDINLRDSLLKGFGIEPGSIERARTAEFVGMQARSSGNTKIDAYRDQLANILYKIVQEEQKPQPNTETLAQLERKYSILLSEHFKYAADLGKIRNLSAYKSATRRAIQSRLIRLIDPDRSLIERYKNPELEIYKKR